MAVIFLVLAFGAGLCWIEIPKMLRTQSYKDLWVFLLLLGLGVVLAILKSFNFDIPNPADWVAWVYAPVAKLVKALTQ